MHDTHWHRIRVTAVQQALVQTLLQMPVFLRVCQLALFTNHMH